MTLLDPTDRLSGDVRAQASTIGVVLILAITLIGATVVVAIGSQAMEDTERATSVSKAEHAMTQFDSRVAMVGLGETRSQRVRLSHSGGGTYATNADDGWMRVRHINYDGDANTENYEDIFNESLGTMTYENDDVTVAYQGGGVWRQQDNGTTMLSPPEFHYRGATLTLPVLRIANDDAASGPTDAFVTRAGQSERVYPDGTKTYNNSTKVYENPVLNGMVEVTVHSTYYKGWAAFFESRTAGAVSIDHANQTATVELQTVGVVGAFGMADALDENGLDVRGQSDGHSVEDFSVVFEKSQGTLSNMHFSFYASQDDHTYETVIHVPSGTSCNGGVDDDDTLELYTFYRNESANEQHEWSNETIPAASGPIRMECGSGDNARVIVDLTANVSQTYGDVKVSKEGTYYDWKDQGPTESANFDQHSDDGEPTTFSSGDQTTTRHLTRHYFALLGNDFTLYAQAGTGSRGGPQIAVDQSSGTLDYKSSGGNYITYLHITENKVEVKLK